MFDGYTSIVDPDPATTKHFRTLFGNSCTVKSEAKDFSSELWQRIASSLNNIAEECKKTG
jgi:predicted HicB family RNase H-like nuclease